MANTYCEAIGEVFTNVSDVLDSGQVIDRLYAGYPRKKSSASFTMRLIRSLCLLL